MVGRGLLLLLCLGMLGGCGRDTPTRTGAERLRDAIAAETGDTNTLLVLEDGKILIRSGGESLTVNQSTHQARPDLLPEDILLPPQARIDLWTEGPRGCTLSCLTDGAPATVLPFFREQWSAAGWNVVSDMVTDGLQGLTFRKGDRQVSLTLEADTRQPSATRLLFFIDSAPPGDAAP